MQIPHTERPVSNHKLSRRSFLQAVAGLSAAGALAACGQAASSGSPASSAASGGGASAAPDAAPAGQVYYLNFKPEADQLWQELAAVYTDRTGVPVRVETASGGIYRSTLRASIEEGGEPPTLFQCGSHADLNLWGNYCLDLTDTAIHKEQTTDDFNLLDSEGRVRCLGFCYEAFGVIVNKVLLAAAGYQTKNITNFASLRTIVEDITARHAAGELPFAAFAPAGLEVTSGWRFSGHLANMPLYYQFRDDGVVNRQPAAIRTAYLDNYKLAWDLYVANSDTPADQLAGVTLEDARDCFAAGQAVFYQNGSWEYDTLVNDYGMDSGALQMIPLYCGVSGEEKAGLCCGTENCWAVNRAASAADTRATLDFIHWAVTDPDSTALLSERLGHLPFKQAPASPNVFFADANTLLAAGCYTVGWAFKQTPNVDAWRSDLVDALNAYTVGQAGWEAVESAFVDGWAKHYAIQQSGV